MHAGLPLNQKGPVFVKTRDRPPLHVALEDDFDPPADDVSVFQPGLPDVVLAPVEIDAVPVLQRIDEPDSEVEPVDVAAVTIRRDVAVSRSSRGKWSFCMLRFTPMPAMMKATRSALVLISVRIPQIFFPSMRTSLGHLSLTCPGQYWK